MNLRRHPHLYEISTWPWLERLSRGTDTHVTLANVPAAEWDRLARLEFDAVFLMGVWKRSSIGRLFARTEVALLDEYDQALPGWRMGDVPGSPYSIQAYEPDERMGGWRGLEIARSELRARGLALILDFVPNHTGFDHEWVRTKPERYVQGTLDDYRRAPREFRPIDHGDAVHFIACGRDPFFPPWADVAQLNYYNPDTREAMIDVLRAIAQHCDGVRCDMAMLVLNDVFQQTWAGKVDLLWKRPIEEFWPTATRAVSSLLYLAEVYWDREFDLQQQGFAYTYDKGLLDRLREGSGDAVRAHLRADAAYADRLVRFLENHDEPRATTALGSRLPAAAVLTLLVPGMRFIFDGQLEGARIRTPVQLGRWQEAGADPALQERYERLLRVANLPLLHEGAWELLDVNDAGDATSGDVIAFTWWRGHERALIIANVSARRARGVVKINMVLPHDGVSLTDELSGLMWHLEFAQSAGGLRVDLDAGNARVFVLPATLA